MKKKRSQIPHPDPKYPIPIPNTRSRSRIPNPGVDFPSPERDGVYIAAIYTPTSPLVSRRTPPLPTSPFPRCQYFASLAAATLFPPHAARAHFAIPSPQRGTAIVRRNLGGGSTKSMSPTSPERDEWRGTAEVRRKCGEGRRVYRGVVIANLSVVCWAHTHANFRIKI